MYRADCETEKSVANASRWIVGLRFRRSFPFRARYAGPVALVSQSGGLSTTFANALMLNRHVGLSHIVSCGNQAGVTVEEYLNYFVEDGNTGVVAAFVEGFKQPAKPARMAGA